MKWRDEAAVTKALQKVTRASESAKDEAIVQAAYAGADFREIADAAGMSLNMTWRRAVKHRASQETAA